jgi:hypothetical protein
LEKAQKRKEPEEVSRGSGGQFLRGEKAQESKGSQRCLKDAFVESNFPKGRKL